MPKGKSRGYSGRNNISDFIVNISTTSDGRTVGVIEHCQTGMVHGFGSFMEMVLLINEKLDEVHFPQSADELRKWAEE